FDEFKVERLRPAKPLLADYDSQAQMRAWHNVDLAAGLDGLRILEARIARPDKLSIPHPHRAQRRSYARGQILNNLLLSLDGVVVQPVADAVPGYKERTASS